MKRDIIDWKYEILNAFNNALSKTDEPLPKPKKIKLIYGPRVAKYIVTFGGGVDSTGMIIKLVKEKKPIDYVFFSNTGGATNLGEKMVTYKHIRLLSKWLKSKGYPKVKTLIYNKEGLYNEVWRRETLPPIAFGYKTCSQKWKIQPVDRYIKKHLKGYHIVKYVAYDASEQHRIKDYSTEGVSVVYPMVEADMDRQDIREFIKTMGLPVPEKSSCFFCPNMRPNEIRRLNKIEPCTMQKAIELERRAMPNMNNIKGLGRNKNWGQLITQIDFLDQFDEDYDNMPCECAL